jgi:hypothetical protein
VQNSTVVSNYEQFNILATITFMFHAPESTSREEILQPVGEQKKSRIILLTKYDIFNGK